MPDADVSRRFLFRRSQDPLHTEINDEINDVRDHSDCCIKFHEFDHLPLRLPTLSNAKCNSFLRKRDKLRRAF